jgi:ribosomal protein S18 acetylase RimI-like enzyme
MDIKIAQTARDFQQARELFMEYAASLDFDLEFQGFAKELEAINTQYRPPKGALLLCYSEENEAIGCVAVRELSEGIAELKRLYIRPTFRHLKMGKRLLSAAVEAARGLGYGYIRLDTVPGQDRAQALYRQFGFYAIDPYRDNPIEGAMYMEKKLED